MISFSSYSMGQQLRGRFDADSDADVGIRLVRRFEEAIANPSAEAMVVLEAATIALARAMRATGQSPESAVIELKALLRGHARQGWTPSIVAERSESCGHPAALIYERLFATWVTAYYAPA